MKLAARSLSQALVVASNDTVRDAIVSSLRALRMGIACTERVDRCIVKLPAGPSLVVLHPDGFRFDQIVGILFALRRERPDVHSVLVTETPERYAKLIAVTDDAHPPSVIPLPTLSETCWRTITSTGANGTQGRTQATSNDGANSPTDSG